MPETISCFLWLAAFIGAIIHLYNGKPPLAVLILLMSIAELPHCYPK